MRSFTASSYASPRSSAAQDDSIASRDELWLRGALIESRLMHGVATQRGDAIEASDARDERLVRACDSAIDEARATVAALRDARVRVVVRATRENDVESVETTMTIASRRRVGRDDAIECACRLRIAASRSEWIRAVARSDRLAERIGRRAAA